MSKKSQSNEKKKEEVAKIFKDWHWKIPHSRVLEVDDELYPDFMVQTGNLVQLNFREIHHNPKRKDKAIELTPEEIQESHLVFDPYHKYRRLYIVLPDDLQKQMKREFWTKNKFAKKKPYQIAKALGGKHSMNDYPDIEVKPIGILTACIYETIKGSDGMSWYIHHMGEETGIRPALTVDSEGRLWIIGGDYTSPIQGITN